VGLELLTAVAMKSPVFWDMTPILEEYVASIFSDGGDVFLRGRLTFYRLHGVISPRMELLRSTVSSTFDHERIYLTNKSKSLRDIFKLEFENFNFISILDVDSGGEGRWSNRTLLYRVSSEINSF
jgi:hypothetical protein